MTRDEQAQLLERWQRAAEDVVSYEDARQQRAKQDIDAASAAIVRLVRDSAEPPSPTRVLELLARGNPEIRQAAATFALQRLVSRGDLLLTPQAALVVPNGAPS